MSGTEGGNHTVAYGTTTSTAEFEVANINGHGINGVSESLNGATSNNGMTSSSSSLPDWLQEKVEQSQAEDVPRPTENGGYSHTAASRAKISAANKGNTPWNKGKGRSEEVKAKIAAGVRRRNRERFLQQLEEQGITEEEYNAQKAKEKAAKEAERKARRTEKGGFRPTEETKKKISQVLKAKWASGEVKKRVVDPSKARRGFTHSAETRAKISASLKKRWATDLDYRYNMVNKTVAANSRDDVRQRISATLKKKWQDPEFRANMTNVIANRKRPSSNSRSASHREKISAAIKLKWQDEAYRKRATEAMARRQAELAKSRPPKVKKPKPPKAKKSTPSRSTVNGAKPAAPAGATPKLAQPMSQPKKKKVLKGVRKKAAPKPATTNISNDLGSGTHLVPPNVKTTTKKKVAKKMTDDPVLPAQGDPLAATTAVEVETAPKPKAKTKKTTKKKKTAKKKKEEPGSVTRMREERRDLYDLLYGDDESTLDEDQGSVLPNSNNVESRISSIFLGDENLDDFDPYGLEDF